MGVDVCCFLFDSKPDVPYRLARWCDFVVGAAIGVVALIAGARGVGIFFRLPERDLGSSATAGLPVNKRLSQPLKLVHHDLFSLTTGAGEACFTPLQQVRGAWLFSPLLLENGTVSVFSGWLTRL